MAVRHSKALWREITWWVFGGIQAAQMFANVRVGSMPARLGRGVQGPRKLHSNVVGGQLLGA